MASKTIAVNFRDGTSTVDAPFNYNNFGNTKIGIGQLSSDLKDITNASTGYTLDVTAAFTGSTGSGSNATSGTGNFPESCCDRYWYTNTTSTLQLGGITSGTTYIIEYVGHQGFQGTRDADVTIGATTTRYDNSTDATPNAAISFSGTVSGTTLDIDVTVVNTFAIMNGIYITLTEPAVLAITTPPTVVKSQTQGTVVIDSPVTAPTTLNTEVKFDNDSGAAATVNSVAANGGDSYDINFTFPRTAAKVFGATGYPLYVEVAAENATTGNIPYSPKTDESYVIIVTPDVSTALYTQYSGSSFLPSDQWVYKNTTTPSGISVTYDDSLFFTLDSIPSSNQTITGYRIANDGTVDVEDTVTFTAEGSDNLINLKLNIGINIGI
jgi:hypothetical protein